MEERVGQDNPLVEVLLRFKDGAALRLKVEPPVAQAEAMAAVGRFVAELGVPLDIEPLDTEPERR